MKEFFKKYGVPLAIVFVGGILISYFWFATNGFIPAGNIGKANWLSFWGSFLAFFGTVFLGLVSIWQNDNAKQATEKANAISEQMLKYEEKSRNRPFVILSDTSVYEKTVCEIATNPDKKYIIVEHNETDLLCIEFRFTNVTDSILSLEYGGIKSDDGTEFSHYSMMNQKSPTVRLLPNKSGEIVICASEDFIFTLISKTLHISLLLKNRFDQKYMETFDFILLHLSSDDKACPKYFENTSDENYKIGKFIDNTNIEWEEKE